MEPILRLRIRGRRLSLSRFKTGVAPGGGLTLQWPPVKQPRFALWLTFVGFIGLLPVVFRAVFQDKEPEIAEWVWVLGTGELFVVAIVLSGETLYRSLVRLISFARKARKLPADELRVITACLCVSVIVIVLSITLFGDVHAETPDPQVAARSAAFWFTALVSGSTAVLRLGRRRDDSSLRNSDDGTATSARDGETGV